VLHHSSRGKKGFSGGIPEWVSASADVSLLRQERGGKRIGLRGNERRKGVKKKSPADALLDSLLGKRRGMMSCWSAGTSFSRTRRVL